MYIDPDGAIQIEESDFEGEEMLIFAFAACEAVACIYAEWQPNGVGVHFHEYGFKPSPLLSRERLDPINDEDQIDLVDRLDYECYLEVYGKAVADSRYPRFQMMWDEWDAEKPR